MITFLLDWIWWIVGFGSFVGVVTLAALFFFAYPLFLSVMSALSGVIKFFQTPLGQVVGAVLIGFLIFAAGWQSGSRYERKQCNEEKLRADLAARKADSATAIKMATEDGVISGEIDVEQLKTEGLVDAYRKKLREQRAVLPPGDGCTLTDDDLESLRLGGD